MDFWSELKNWEEFIAYLIVIEVLVKKIKIVFLLCLLGLVYKVLLVAFSLP